MNYPDPTRAIPSALAVTLAATLALSGAALGQDEPTPEPMLVPAPLQSIDYAPFTEAIAALTPERMAELDELVIEADFASLQEAMDAGDVSAVELTTYYIARSQEHEDLNSLLQLNPDALRLAARSDERRAKGKSRGPLEGIPLTLKGNIGTKDKTMTSAGAVALAENISDRDSRVAANLRKAGGVLLGKANMSEWAGWIYPAVEDVGFSALGGFPVNPYDPALPVWGSSSGSGVGVGANLTAASVGTETSGSLIAPAAASMTVGIHPSLGVVSRDRVIPLTSQTDTPGPVAKHVADAAALLTVIAGKDKNDSVTLDAAKVSKQDFTTSLKPDALDGKRVGLWIRAPRPEEAIPDEELAEVLEAFGYTKATAGLEAAGAEVVLAFAPPLEQPALLDVINNGLRLEFEDYISQVDPDGSIGSIADVIAFNQEDEAVRAPFGEGFLVDSAASSLSQEEYEALAAELRAEARAYIDDILASNDIDVLVTKGNQFSNSYAMAGYPAITVPDGDLAEVSGVTFVGDYLSDPDLIGMAYAFEQATMARTAPPIDG